MNTNSLGLLKKCQICDSKNLVHILSMGHFAPCDSLLTVEMLNQAETRYPMNLKYCEDCSLVQIDYAVNPEELFFPEYPYRSGITETLKKNLHQTSSRVAETIGLKKDSFVIDIGSNDGTILEGFQNIGMKVLGIEATNIANIANENGIATMQTFFNSQTAAKVLECHGEVDLTIAANVFAHVNDVHDFLEGVSNMLKDNGYFVSESHYLVDILETLQYDSVYHEHLRFYSLKSLEVLFRRHGFSLVDVERISNYGGSVRVYAQKGLNHESSKSVKDLYKLEEERSLYSKETYFEFAKQIKKSKNDLRAMLVNLRNEGKRIVGIGCPGRSATLLEYCGLDTSIIDYIAEQSTSLKLGMFTPGTHIPIIDEKEMMENQPDYCLMLSWHYAKPIIKKLREKGLKSDIIIPLPKITIDKFDA